MEEYATLVWAIADLVGYTELDTVELPIFCSTAQSFNLEGE